MAPGQSLAARPRRRARKRRSKISVPVRPGRLDDLFEPAAILAVHKVAKGTHRLIDRFATDALTLAALDNRDRVTDDVYNASKAI